MAAYWREAWCIEETSPAVKVREKGINVERRRRGVVGMPARRYGSWSWVAGASVRAWSKMGVSVDMDKIT